MNPTSEIRRAHHRDDDNLSVRQELRQLNIRLKSVEQDVHLLKNILSELGQGVMRLNEFVGRFADRYPLEDRDPKLNPMDSVAPCRPLRAHQETPNPSPLQDRGDSRLLRFKSLLLSCFVLTTSFVN
ncbi:Aste57867_2339 [Aphanomyces stellatus]|uniref:Aste57867_2339 protein n=1 Tax=Aphanomyces stellatus TaxID=120398 RepID=A0A485KBM5_9STRA|nr:hypothetical protein As57867_002334 [Aphanomyces stellatus]VFT79541.1 Aste57867_2339 [Aphanomyces stellatus]